MGLELAVLNAPSADAGYIAGFAVSEGVIFAAGGTSAAPTVIALAAMGTLERKKTPRDLGLRDVLAVGDELWVCGEYGQLACSRCAATA